VTLRLDDEEPEHRRIRSVIVGNCGELTGGVRLMPTAEIDDGWLDVIIIAPRGLMGWASLVAAVLSRTKGIPSVMRHVRCRTIEIRAERPLHVQLDGDLAGVARVLRASVDPLALVVRTR
jgi:diacylglycerol kinase (ATP)